MKILSCFFVLCLSIVGYSQNKPNDDIANLLKNRVESDIDTVAEFPLGQKNMFKFLHKEFDRRRCKVKKGTKLYFACIISKSGVVKKINLVNKNVSKELKSCSCNILLNMPRWRPAQYKGKKIESSFIVSLYF